MIQPISGVMFHAINLMNIFVLIGLIGALFCDSIENLAGCELGNLLSHYTLKNVSVNSLLGVPSDAPIDSFVFIRKKNADAPHTIAPFC